MNQKLSGETVYTLKHYIQKNSTNTITRPNIQILTSQSDVD